MYSIPIILGSIRRGRQSPKVARFIQHKLTATGQVTSDILDLAEFNLPPMQERVAFREDTPATVLTFHEKLRQADAFIIVSPDYNNSYPGVLKNALDYFWTEIRRKPVGICTASANPCGGFNVSAQLQFLMLSMHAIPITNSLHATLVDRTFDDEGHTSVSLFNEQADWLVAEMIWYTQMVQRQMEAVGPLPHDLPQRM